MSIEDSDEARAVGGLTTLGLVLHSTTDFKAAQERVTEELASMLPIKPETSTPGNAFTQLTVVCNLMFRHIQ